VGSTRRCEAVFDTDFEPGAGRSFIEVYFFIFFFIFFFILSSS